MERSARFDANVISSFNFDFETAELTASSTVFSICSKVVGISQNAGSAVGIFGYVFPMEVDVEAGSLAGQYSRML